MLAFLNLGGPEIVFIFLAIVLLFGAKKLPELARGIGRSLGEFRKAKDDFDRELHHAADDLEEEKKKKLAAGSTSPVSTDSDQKS